MPSTPLSIRTCTQLHCRRNLANYQSWRKVTSLIGESSTIARRRSLPLQKAVLSDADHNRTMVLGIPVSTATTMVAATA